MRASCTTGSAPPIPCQNVLKNQFLLANKALGVDEILASRRHLRIGARHFNRRQSALIDLAAVVFSKPLRGCQRFLLHPQIFIQTHQIRIEPDDARDRDRRLKPEDMVGQLLTVLRDADKPPVEFDAEASQQRLRDRSRRGSSCK